MRLRQSVIEMYKIAWETGWTEGPIFPSRKLNYQGTDSDYFIVTNTRVQWNSLFHETHRVKIIYDNDTYNDKSKAAKIVVQSLKDIFVKQTKKELAYHRIQKAHHVCLECWDMQGLRRKMRIIWSACLYPVCTRWAFSNICKYPKTELNYSNY